MKSGMDYHKTGRIKNLILLKTLSCLFNTKLKEEKYLGIAYLPYNRTIFI